MRDFGEVEHLQVSIKGPGDFVSAADRRAEQIMRQELSAGPAGLRLPAGGERRRGRAHDREQRWIVDPLDGTTNFLHGLPHWAISIALEHHGELVAGVVYDPIKDELFCAEKGAGAYLNDRRLRVSRRSDLAPLPDRHRHAGARLARPRAGLRRGSSSGCRGEVAGLRRLGTASLDLAYVAAGRLDGFWEYGLKPWDIAAGIVLVREAGGLVGRLEGEGDLAAGTLVASNAVIHPRLVQLLRVNE